MTIRGVRFPNPKVHAILAKDCVCRSGLMATTANPKVTIVNLRMKKYFLGVMLKCRTTVE
jgi:hypothetical protein